MGLYNALEALSSVGIAGFAFQVVGELVLKDLSFGCSTKIRIVPSSGREGC